MRERTKGLLQSLGPGLLFAGAAVGVSHLVQSTRAGASYGFMLLWIVLLANILKYPFFEFGPRYAAATGESLVEGYFRLGRWAFWLFIALTVCTMFIIQAAVLLVTAALAAYLLPGWLSLLGWCAVLMFLFSVLLVLGQYAWLDGLMKGVIILLSLSTLLAFVVASGHRPTLSPAVVQAASDSLWSLGGVAFLMALVGWMPTPVECSAWHSLWTIERREQTGHQPTLREASFDFHVGYIVTALLAVAFLGLGAWVMFGTGQTFSSSSTKFVAQLIQLYTKTLGGWSFWLIAIAAFSAMFSTTLTVTDAYPRVLQRSAELVFPEHPNVGRKAYWITLIVLGVGALLIVSLFLKRLKVMVDFATIVSFVTAPIFAYINYRVVLSPHMPEEARPPLWLRILSWAGIVSLSGFSLFYAGWRIWRWVG